LDSGTGYYASVQLDGNFVIYKGNTWTAPNAIWATNTGGVGSGPFALFNQPDGNLVLYDGSGQPNWASNTYDPNRPVTLTIQTYGVLALRDKDNKSVW
jgi:hypothetical protein